MGNARKRFKTGIRKSREIKEEGGDLPSRGRSQPMFARFTSGQVTVTSSWTNWVNPAAGCDPKIPVATLARPRP